jgi:hypothetical protein
VKRRLASYAFALLLSACLGPKPIVARVTLHAPERENDSSYILVAEVRNEAGGEGEISFEAKLTNRQSDQTYRAGKKLHLGPNETTIVTLRIEAPAGDYATEAKTEYPPR